MGYIPEAVAELVNKESQEEILTRTYAQRDAALNPFIDSAKDENELLDVYHHFTTIAGKKYQITLGNARTKIIRFKEIEAVLKNEKQDVNAIPFPVVLNYYSPRPYDPYGTSLVDLLQDKHRYRNLLANLRFIREKDMALGDDIIYDTNLINRNDLSKSTFNKKYIGVDGRM